MRWQFTVLENLSDRALKHVLDIRKNYTLFKLEYNQIYTIYRDKFALIHDICQEA